MPTTSATALSPLCYLRGLILSMEVEEERLEPTDAVITVEPEAASGTRT